MVLTLEEASIFVWMVMEEDDPHYIFRNSNEIYIKNATSKKCRFEERACLKLAVAVF
ncbi:hypothetical protein ACT7C9_24900 [Bacillus cereus]